MKESTFKLLLFLAGSFILMLCANNNLYGQVQFTQYQITESENLDHRIAENLLLDVLVEGPTTFSIVEDKGISYIMQMDFNKDYKCVNHLFYLVSYSKPVVNKIGEVVGYQFNTYSLDTDCEIEFIFWYGGPACITVTNFTADTFTQLTGNLMYLIKQ